MTRPEAGRSTAAGEPLWSTAPAGSDIRALRHAWVCYPVQAAQSFPGATPVTLRTRLDYDNADSP